MLEQKATINDVLLLNGADKEAKAYAFLHAAFRKTEVGENPVRDALDCLVPFIAPFANAQAGQVIDAQSIGRYLHEVYGFQIPLYAIDQMFPQLQAHGIITFKRSARVYLANSTGSDFDVARDEIETDFNTISERLEKYVANIEEGFQPPAGTWSSALIKFLKGNVQHNKPEIRKIKDVFLNPGDVENALVGSFLLRLQEESLEDFDKILKIYMGILVEEFISTLSEIGDIEHLKGCVAFFDTGILLRQLGSSGKNLQVATEELTRYLQDLGFETRYFSGNEGEVTNIIDTIISITDAGRELEGETAAAISAGEVSITDIRELQHQFPEKLARSNIFEAGNLEVNAIEYQNYQIDETKFAEFLKKSALESNRAYRHTNSMNDAGYVAAIMRLRRGRRSRDLADSKFVFITPNKFLAVQSRRFLIEEKQLAHNTAPPVLTVGQIATIAWLLKEHKIPPRKAGRELLATCYAAFRPDADWFRFFREGVEKVVGNIDEYASNAGNLLTLKAMRRIAQEETFGNSAIVRKMSMAEILQKAEDSSRDELHGQQRRLEAEIDRVEDQLREAKAEFARAEGEREASNRLMIEEATAKAMRDGRLEQQAETARVARAVASYRAGFIIDTLRWTLLFTILIVTIVQIYRSWGSGSDGGVAWTLFLAIFTLAGYADQLKFKFVQSATDLAKLRLQRIFDSTGSI